jgi:hypothetical protein
MLLILPVFLGIVFTIMETGYMSFNLILLNHATFEVARIGGMTYNLPGGPGGLEPAMKRILPLADVQCLPVPNAISADPQAPTVQSTDLVCTGTENVKLIFPISSILLSTKGAPPGTRTLTATVHMPIEQMLPQ